MHTPTQREITLMLQLKSCSGGIAGEEMGCTVFLNPWISILLFRRGDQNPGRWVLGAEAAQVILGPTVLPTSTKVIPTLFSFLHACGVHQGCRSSRQLRGPWPETQCAGEFRTSPLVAVESGRCPEWQTLIHNFTLTLLSSITLRFSEQDTFSGFRNKWSGCDFCFFFGT